MMDRIAPGEPTMTLESIEPQRAVEQVTRETAGSLG